VIGLKMRPPRSTPDPRPLGGTGPRGELYEPESRREFVEAYRDRIWVRRSVDLLRNTAASVPLKAMRGKGTPDRPHPDDVEVEGHDILRLIQRPNHRDPNMKLVSETIFWSQTVGDWWWEIVPARGGGIAELYRLRAYSVRVEPDANGRVTGIAYRPNLEAEPVIELDMATPPRVQPGTVVAGRFTSPLDDYYGMSPLRAAKDAIVSEYYAVRYDQRFFRNSGRPDLIIGFEKGLTDQERDANRKEWQAFKGLDRAHKAAILGGNPSVHLLGQTPRDMEYREGRKMSREEEVAAFGVPPMLVGITDNATYSNYETARTVLWETTVQPLLDFICSWITFALVPFYPDIDYVRPDYSQVEALQTSQGERSERAAREVASGIRTPNEARQLAGIEPLDDPAADQLYQPMSLVSFTGEEDSDPDVGGSDAADPAQPGDLPNADDLKAKAVTIDPWPEPTYQAKAGGIPTDIAVKWMRTRGRTLDKLTGLMAGQIKSRLMTDRDELLAELGVKKTVPDLEAVIAAHDWNGTGEDLITLVETFHIAAAEQGATQTTGLIGGNLDFFTLDNPAIRGMLEEIADRPKGVKTVPDDLRDQVLAEVREGVRYGLTASDVANGGTFHVGPPGARDTEKVTLKGIRGVYQEFETWKGVRIARTETAHAFNRSSAMTMREAGVDEVDIDDGTDCDKGCADANGERWPLTKYESEPLAHPNCRRVGLPVIK